MVTGDVRLTRVSTVPIGVESNCVLCEAHTEAEETHFITETEFFVCEMCSEGEERIELQAHNTILKNKRAKFQQKNLTPS